MLPRQSNLLLPERLGEDEDIRMAERTRPSPDQVAAQMLARIIAKQRLSRAVPVQSMKRSIASGAVVVICCCHLVCACVALVFSVCCDPV